MARQVMSRSQRRMEKRQALVLLVLVLAVSLVSFTLGVMVGRGGSSSADVPATAKIPARLPVQPGGVPDDTPGASQSSREKLTFYDSLPKGEPSPLGSGINLPPEEVAAGKKAVGGTVAEPKEDSIVVKHKSAEPTKVRAMPPAADEGGAYAVQVASFRGAEDARKLKERLTGKDYAAFVETADLQEKGVWYRVFVGPYKDADGAQQVAARLKAEEQLTGLVRKR